MQYSATENEIKLFTSMPDDERFRYCLSRMTESEEIWGLAEHQGWVISDINDQATLPIWPYKDLAELYKQDEWKNAEPQSVSLEHFVYKTSQLLIKNDIMIQTFPTVENPGKVIPAKEFFEILENLMESGEYYMEG